MTKPDPLTPEERSEVEARIATTAVLPVWDGQKLVMPQDAPHGFRTSMNRFQGKDTKPQRRKPIAAQKLPPHVEKRRAEVAALHAKGCTIADMVKALQGVSNSAVRNDLARLGLVPHVWVDPRLVDHDARARQIRDLAKDLGVTLVRQRRADAGFRAVGDIANEIVGDVRQRKSA